MFIFIRRLFLIWKTCCKKYHIRIIGEILLTDRIGCLLVYNIFLAFLWILLFVLSENGKINLIVIFYYYRIVLNAVLVDSIVYTLFFFSSFVLATMCCIFIISFYSHSMLYCETLLMKQVLSSLIKARCSSLVSSTFVPLNLNYSLVMYGVKFRRFWLSSCI